MRAIFLGTADGHTSPRRDHSGILLQTDETSVLLDCGAMAAQFILTEKMAPEVPGILWISHMHSDHNGQISSLIQSLWLRHRRATLHFYGPGEVLRPIRDWLEKCLLFPELIGFPIEWHSVKPGEVYVQGALTFTPFSTDHLTSLSHRFKRDYPDTCFDCYGTVIDYKGSRYIYSADLEHPRELIPLLKQGPVRSLLCEATHFPERDLFQQIAGFPVESIWLTHYPERLVEQEAELRSLAVEEKFGGKVYLVQDRVAHEI